MSLQVELMGWVAAVGLPLAGLAWLATRRLIRHPRLSRGCVCLLVAASVTPTACVVCGSPTILPAVFISLSAFAAAPEPRLMGLVHGALPIVTVAALLFCGWSFHAERPRSG